MPKLQGIYNASSAKPDCIQKNYLMPTPLIYGEEDCLYLNLYRPEVSEITLGQCEVLIHLLCLHSVVADRCCLSWCSYMAAVSLAALQVHRSQDPSTLWTTVRSSWSPWPIDSVRWVRKEKTLLIDS